MQAPRKKYNSGNLSYDKDYDTVDDSIDNSDIIRLRIDSIRRRKGMTQKQFAEALEISQSAVSKYLNGRMPPADVMLKIARIGETSVEWILTGHEKQYGAGYLLFSEDSKFYGTSADFFNIYNNLPPSVRSSISALLHYFENQRK